MFKGDLDVGGGPEGEFKGNLEVDLEGDFRGDFKPDLEGDLLSSSGQVQVLFSIELKFNSFELDSEVGRLVSFVQGVPKNCPHVLPPTKKWHYNEF